MQAHKETIDNNQKKIKILKVKSEIKNNYQEIVLNITSLEIFYLNTSELISDFLEN